MFVFVFLLIGIDVGFANELAFLAWEFVKKVETGSYVDDYYFSTKTIFFINTQFEII